MFICSGKPNFIRKKYKGFNTIVNCPEKYSANISIPDFFKAYNLY